MKLLYVTPRNPQYDYFNKEHTKLFEFKNINNFIITNLQNKLKGVEITQVADLFTKTQRVSSDRLAEFDLFLCDVTACNPNVTYVAGIAEMLGKPIIYIASHESMVPLFLVDKQMLMYSDSSLENEFIDELVKTLNLAISNPSGFVAKGKQQKSKPKVFISYSHKDKSYLDRLMTHLKPLSKKGLLDIWVDTRIKSGDKWKEEIETALSEANIAILLISADFMASDFIVDNELPPILQKSEVKGTKILPVILSPCRFSREAGLNCFQAVNDPAKPLSLMNPEEREIYYDSVATDIEKTI